MVTFLPPLTSIFKMLPFKIQVLSVQKQVIRSFMFGKCSPYTHPTCKPPRLPMKVTILGASTRMGEILSLLLKQSRCIDELRLYSASEETCGTAMDLSEIDTNTKIRAYLGPKMLMHAIEGVQILVLCSELPACPQKESVLLEKVGYAVRNYAIYASEFNPNAIFCITCSPVNSLVPLVTEEYKRAGVYDPRKILGMSMAANIRANAILACNTCQNACGIRVPILGGLCSNSIVPILSQQKSLQPEIAKAMYGKIRKSEDDVLTMKTEEGSGECALLQAFAASRFVNSVVYGLRGKKVFECAYIRQTGHIGQFLPYMSSLVRLGKDGVQKSYMPQISNYECCLLKEAAKKVRNSIHLGISFVTGELPKQPRRVPYTPDYCPPLDLNCHLLKINVSKPDKNPCGIVKGSSKIDEHQMRSKQRAIKLRMERKARRNDPIEPEPEKRKFCKKKF